MGFIKAQMAAYHTLISMTGIACEYMYVHVCVIYCCRADVNGNGSLDEKEFYQFVEQVSSADDLPINGL